MDGAVGDGDGVVAFVDGVVVAAAEQGEVVEAGGAAVDPVDDVVGVAVRRRRLTDDATLVTLDQGAAHRPVDEALLGTDIQGLRVGA